MFFVSHVLSRRGSLGTIWIAAHLEKKLKKQQIAEADIAESVCEFGSSSFWPTRL